MALCACVAAGFALLWRGRAQDPGGTRAGTPPATAIQQTRTPFAGTVPPSASCSVFIDARGLGEALREVPIPIVLTGAYAQRMTRHDSGRILVRNEAGKQMNYEIEEWRGDRVALWVVLGEIAAGKVVRVDVSVTQDGKSPSATPWPSSFQFVYHCDALGTIRDSSITDVHLERGAVVLSPAGRVGPALDGVASSAAFTDRRRQLTTLHPTFTLQASLLISAPGSAAAISRPSRSSAAHWEVGLQNAVLRAAVQGTVLTAPAAQRQRWIDLALVREVEQLTLFIDGREVATAACPAGPATTADQSLVIGASRSGSTPNYTFIPWPGLIDEVRLSTVARSKAWVAFQHDVLSGRAVMTVPAP